MMCRVDNFKRERRNLFCMPRYIIIEYVSENPSNYIKRFEIVNRPML